MSLPLSNQSSSTLTANLLSPVQPDSARVWRLTPTPPYTVLPVSGVPLGEGRKICPSELFNRIPGINLPLGSSVFPGLDHPPTATAHVRIIRELTQDEILSFQRDTSAQDEPKEEKIERLMKIAVALSSLRGANYTCVASDINLKHRELVECLPDKSCSGELVRSWVENNRQVFPSRLRPALPYPLGSSALPKKKRKYEDKTLLTSSESASLGQKFIHEGPIGHPQTEQRCTVLEKLGDVARLGSSKGLSYDQIAKKIHCASFPYPDLCREKGKRAFIRGVMWKATTGASWETLPKEYGKWQTVYGRFAKWEEKGIWQMIFNTLSMDEDTEWTIPTKRPKMEQNFTSLEALRYIAISGSNKGLSYNEIAREIFHSSSAALFVEYLVGKLATENLVECWIEVLKEKGPDGLKDDAIPLWMRYLERFDISSFSKTFDFKGDEQEKKRWILIGEWQKGKQCIEIADLYSIPLEEIKGIIREFKEGKNLEWLGQK